MMILVVEALVSEAISPSCKSASSAANIVVLPSRAVERVSNPLLSLVPDEFKKSFEGTRNFSGTVINFCNTPSLEN